MKDEIKEIIYLEKYVDKYKRDEESIINGNILTTPAMLDYLEVKALLDYITNLQEENKRLKELDENYPIEEQLEEALKWKNIYKSRIDKANECIKKDTRWFDSEYAKVYGKLVDCAGAKGDRLEVLVKPSNLSKILGGDKDVKD